MCSFTDSLNLTSGSSPASGFYSSSSSFNAFVDDMNSFIREINSLAGISHKRLFQNYKATSFPRMNRTLDICLPKAHTIAVNEAIESPKSVENRTLEIPFQTPLVNQIALELVEVDSVDNPFESLFPIHPIKDDIKSITARINLASAKTGIIESDMMTVRSDVDHPIERNERSGSGAHVKQIQVLSQRMQERKMVCFWNSRNSHDCSFSSHAGHDRRDRHSELRAFFFVGSRVRRVQQHRLPHFDLDVFGVFRSDGQQRTAGFQRDDVGVEQICEGGVAELVSERSDLHNERISCVWIEYDECDACEEECED